MQGLFELAAKTSRERALGGASATNGLDDQSDQYGSDVDNGGSRRAAPMPVMELAVSQGAAQGSVRPALRGSRAAQMAQAAAERGSNGTQSESERESLKSEQDRYSGRIQQAPGQAGRNGSHPAKRPAPNKTLVRTPGKAAKWKKPEVKTMRREIDEW